MDQSYISALAGLMGAAIGGLTSFATSWLTQRTQLREESRGSLRKQRETLFFEFIDEAARLYGDALVSQKDDVMTMVRLYALVAHIRLVASPAVIAAAERTVDGIIDTYQSGNWTLHELREFAAKGGLEPLRALGEACREELAVLGSRTHMQYANVRFLRS